MKAQDLKNSILQMAVQGKLVPQDPADEPASALLERIRGERAELIKQKKVKAPKGGESVIYRGSDGSHYEKRGNGEPVCIDDEIPFEIPASWEWTRMASLASMISGTSFKKGDITNQGIRVIRGGNIEVPNIVLKDDDVYLGSSFADVEKSLHAGDIVIVASTGSSTAIGRPGFAHEAMPSVQIGAFLRIVRSSFVEFAPWNQLIFSSDYYRARIRELAKGTNINNVKESYVMEMLVPIPPLAEQQRIVERIDELMPLVEEYGRLEDAREALDAALPERLRKSVLQMAVQGKLVEQDPADEPASVLLERIREERADLIKQKKIKAPKGSESVIYREGGSWYERRGKSEPVCIDDEIPFETPENWEWTRLGTLCAKIGSGSTPPGGRNAYVDEGPMLLRSQNVHNDGLRLAGVARFKQETFNTRGSHVEPKDVLLNVTGASIGRSAVVPDVFEDADVNQHVLILRQINPDLRWWVHEVIVSPLVQGAIMAVQAGATKEGLSAAKASNLLIPIPPLVEQQRIVARVEKLVALIAVSE